MTVVNALGVGPLRGKAVITTAASPTMGDCNTYNTTTAGTSLGPTLPQAAIQTVGAQMLVEKDANDSSVNTVIFTCYSGESFTSGATSLTLTNSGQSRILQIVNIGGILQWKITGGFGTPDLQSLSTAQSALPLIIALG